MNNEISKDKQTDCAKFSDRTHFSKKLRIIFTGDFCPINRIQALIQKEQYDRIYNNFLSILLESDLALTNLECPLIGEGDCIEKTGPCLKAPVKSIEALKFAGFNIVTLANNHIMDYGIAGLNSTLKCCRSAGISWVGVGDNIETARKPFYTDVRGNRLAFINICENEWSTSKGEEAGANPLNPVSNFYQIIEAKSKADYVIVIVHGGHEHYAFPSPRMKETYRFFVDAGASAVIGHHSHCFSGYEVYRGSPIFYSLGNFIFDYPGQAGRGWSRGFAVCLILSNEIDFEITPYIQNDEEIGVHLMNKKDREIFDEELKFINEVILDDNILSKYFVDFSNKSAGFFKLVFEPYPINSLMMALRNRNLLPNLMSEKTKKYLLNIIRCEAHRDVLLNILEQRKKS